MWASTILAIIKAVPAVQKLFTQVMELYYAELDRQLESESAKVQKEREALVASLKLEGLTAEQRSVIRRRLHELQK
jgi:hypothetical protein